MPDRVEQESIIVSGDDMLRAWDRVPYAERYGSKKQSIASTLAVLEVYRRSGHDTFPGVDVEATSRIKEALGTGEYEYDLFALGAVIDDIRDLDGFGKVHTERLIQVSAKVLEMVLEN